MITLVLKFCRYIQDIIIAIKPKTFWDFPKVKLLNVWHFFKNFKSFESVEIQNPFYSFYGDKIDRNFFVVVHLGSSGSAGTAFRLDSQESTASVEDTGSVTWSASRVNSINAKEWDIPYESLTFVEKIGAGRFSEGKIFTQLTANQYKIFPDGIPQSIEFGFLFS